MWEEKKKNIYVKIAENILRAMKKEDFVVINVPLILMIQEKS